MQPSQIESVVLVVGGVDPSGGAGVVRDVLTATALGSHPLVVGTAWTEQGADVHRVEARAPEALSDSVRHALSRRPSAVKIGMVPDAASLAAIVAALGAYAGPVVVDPVLASSRGGALTRAMPSDWLPLLRRATLATPNATEAAAFLGLPVTDLDEAAAAGRALGAAGVAAVLVKGGHLNGEGNSVTDTLCVADRTQQFSRARVRGGDVRGTGCALATAIAVHLGRGAPLAAAIDAATLWLGAALASAVFVDGERHLPSR